MNGLLKNKTAVITGCNRGIGKAILQRFAEEEANVIACTRKNDEAFNGFCTELQNKFKIKGYVCELNVLNNFWTARVTSHIPLKDVVKNITIKNILEPIKLVNKYLKKNGLKNPKVGVQALNPHAEFGNEEKKIIIPAINKARKMKIKAFGPLPCDTSFIRAYKNKEYNCLVGMYHDAIQSGLKSFGFEKGVTVQGGLPIPITTPAHGTAFDIVGKNKANVSPMLESLKLLLKLLS